MTSSNPEALSRSLGLFSGTLLCLGTIIGSGIFSTPALVLRDIVSPVASILMWVLAGGICFLGVATYVELGTMRPRSGGEKEYLAIGFPQPRKLASFSFTYTLMGVIRPAACAADCIVFASYVLYASHGGVLVKAAKFGDAVWWTERGIAVASALGVAMLQMVSTTWAIRTQNVLSVIKVLLLVFIAFSGVLVMSGGWTGVTNPGNFSNPALKASTDPTSYVYALYLIFFTYDGKLVCFRHDLELA